MHRLVPSALVLALLAGAARADTLHVPHDFATIQAAVDAAHPGDTILLAAGLYVEDVSFTSISTLAVQGQGDARVSGDFVLNACDHVTLSRLRFVGGAPAMEVIGGQSITASHCRFEPLPATLADGPAAALVTADNVATLGFDHDSFKGGAASALLLGASGLVSPASVDHCQFRNSGQHGIDLEHVDGVDITHCTFRDVFHDAVHADVTASINDVTVSHDVFRSADNGVRFLAGQAVHVDHDQFLQCIAAGIESDAPGEFADNHLKQIADVGIVIGVDAASVTGNVIRHCTLGGLTATGAGLVIASNDVRAVGFEFDSHGILVTGDGAAISGNTIKSVIGAGLVSLGNDVAVSGNHVAVTTDVGLQFDGNLDTVTANVCHHAGTIGFDVQGTGNTLTDNVGKGSGQFDLFDHNPGQNSIDASNTFGTTNP